MPHLHFLFVDTTIAELIKNVTDKKLFLEQLYTEHRTLCGERERGRERGRGRKVEPCPPMHAFFIHVYYVCETMREPEPSKSIMTCLLYIIIIACAELREEDNADKANDYIETCIGKSEPLAKVSDNLHSHLRTKSNVHVFKA